MMAILIILKSGVSRKKDFEFQSKVHPHTKQPRWTTNELSPIIHL